MSHDGGDRHIVLVVDDDQAVRDALRELLETEGYAVEEAADGRSALQRLQAGLRPSVILLDLMMPVMDGWDFRQAQLADPNLRDLPVLIITAAGFSADTIRTQFGDTEFVHKPPPPAGLLAAVRRVADGSSR